MLRLGFHRIAALIAALLVAATLAGCGVNSGDTTDASTEVHQSTDHQGRGLVIDRRRRYAFAALIDSIRCQ